MKVILLNAKKNSTESREIVNPDIVQKYFSSLYFTSAGQREAQAFCRKAIFRISLDLDISERKTGTIHRRGHFYYNQ